MILVFTLVPRSIDNALIDVKLFKLAVNERFFFYDHVPLKPPKTNMAMEIHHSRIFDLLSFMGV